tara:strand:- start:261 stop:1148 length:888 start_codon:yes stop_codon:yes gene_type:complete
MEIVSTLFDEKHVEKNGIGAGILPFSINEEGKYCLLLAKEKFNPSWKGSNRWSGFEGGKKMTETYIDNAFREFKEESLNTIVTEENIKKVLEESRYNLKLVVNIKQEKMQTKYHVTYLVFIPWQTKCIEEFTKIREKLQNLKMCEDILKKLYQNLSIFQLYTKTNIGYILSVKSIENKDDDEMCVTYMVKDDDESIVEKKVICPMDSKACMWQYMRKCITFMLKFYDHEAITKSYDYLNIIHNVSVNEDYLEKEKMKWWEFDKLEKVVSNGGTYENELFKPFFIPVVKSVLDTLS